MGYGRIAMNQSALMKACDTFARVARIIDKLPNKEFNDETPLREMWPGIWPTVGDIRRLRTEMVKFGWKP